MMKTLFSLQHFYIVHLFCLGLLLVTLEVPAQSQKKADSTAILCGETQRQLGLKPDQPLIDRVQPASEETLRMFREAGMSPGEHPLTNSERKQLEQVFASLPPLHQQILKGHLRSISFLDNMPNTALTSTVSSGADCPVFDITVRAAIFNQTASEWMTEKERTCFNPVNSQAQVFCDIGQLSALLYVLLHETTHMVDGTLHIAEEAAFSKGIWADRTHIASQYSHPLLDSIRYRGGKPLRIHQAKPLYQSLSATPFVSLYSTNSRNEDLAEYLSVYHFTQKLNQPFRIIIRDKGKDVYKYEPMKSKLVRSRMKEMARFYSLPGANG